MSNSLRVADPCIFVFVDPRLKMRNIKRVRGLAGKLERRILGGIRVEEEV